jgi:hypothetical protein
VKYTIHWTITIFLCVLFMGYLYWCIQVNGFHCQQNKMSRSISDGLVFMVLGLQSLLSWCDLLRTYIITGTPWGSSYWEANRFSARQGISHILPNPTVNHCSHKWPTHDPTLNHIDPVHALHILNPEDPALYYLSYKLGSPKWYFALDFSTKTLYTPLFSPLCATCPTQLIILDFITKIILGEEHTLLSSSVCNLLHSYRTSSLLGPIFSLTPCSQTLSLRSSLNASDQFHTYTKKNKQNYISVYLNYTSVYLNYTSVYLNLKFLDSKWQTKHSAVKIVSNSSVKCVLNLSLNTILIPYDCSQISYLFHTFKGTIIKI